MIEQTLATFQYTNVSEVQLYMGLCEGIVWYIFNAACLVRDLKRAFFNR